MIDGEEVRTFEAVGRLFRGWERSTEFLNLVFDHSPRNHLVTTHDTLKRLENTAILYHRQTKLHLIKL